MAKFISELDWFVIILLAFGLGLAPFTPPHLYDKLIRLSQGNLVKPLDWFDLVMHGLPWLLFISKAVISKKKKQRKERR